MRISPKVRSTLLMVLVGGGFWSIGYIQGNADGSGRIARANLITHSATLKRFEDGDLDAARVYSAMFVRVGDKYIHSSPFWWTALKESFTVRNQELFDRQLPLARQRVEWAANAPPIQTNAPEAEPNNEER